MKIIFLNPLKSKALIALEFILRGHKTSELSKTVLGELPAISAWFQILDLSSYIPAIYIL